MYAGNGGVLRTSTNPEILTFASGYDVTTEFFIPSLNTAGTYATSTFGSQLVQVNFVKAK